MSDQKFCQTGKLGCFLDAVAHSTEKRKDHEEKVIVLTLRAQPFTAQLATAIDSRMRTSLFRLNHPDPHEHLRRVDFALGLVRQQLEIYATPDTVKPSILFDHVKITNVYVRTEKNVSGFALVFKATFGPVGDRELGYVEQWRNNQAFISFDVADPSAEFEDGEEEDPELKEAPQRKLPDPDFDTDGAGKPTDQTATAADGPKKAEPARQRLHSHAGGKKKAARGSKGGRR